MKSIHSFLATSLVLSAAISTSGCFKYLIKTGAGGDTRGTPTKSVWQHHLVDGLIGEGVVDVAAVCNSPDATITIERNIVDAILGNMTGNILWNPSTINIYCGDKVSKVELNAEQTERVASTEAFREAVEETAPERLPELERAVQKKSKKANDHRAK